MKGRYIALTLFSLAVIAAAVALIYWIYALKSTP